METTNRTEIQELKEEQKIAQSTLCLGYRTDIRIGDPLYQAMRVFNGMFGKYFHSELYKEIREKHSLAYYINSEYASRKGALFITSGINKDSYNKVLTLISNVLAAFQAGDLDEENFELTKKAIINNMIEAYDQQTGLYRELLFFIEQKAERKSLEERIKEIESVTKEEVIACSKNLRLDTIFFLEGTNGDEEYA
ncbi:MAG TPA: insulinase family protein [Bacilli bacterium]|nr:insulinase family protein [Bacilli bacterium]